VFALELKGTAAPVPGSDTWLRARTSATGQTLRSVLKPEGVQAAVEPAGGDAASFDSEVEMVGEGAFLESGTITYGQAGKIVFKTVGRGVIGQGPLPGTQRGAVIWEITGDEGRFAGAQGIITSNFTVGDQGAVRDDQFAVIFLPG
jgi:hypothetical protein